MTDRSKLRIALIVAVALAAVLVPVAVFASHTFDDVPDSNWAHDDIAWLAEKGLTSGCQPNLYCPDDPVSRREIAAFTHRESQKLAPRFAVAPDGSERAVGGDATVLLDSVYFSVPNSGGAVELIAPVGFESGAADDVLGWVWLELNNAGACNSSNFVAATTVYSTVVTGFASPVVVGGFAPAPGDYRVDLCAWGVGDGTAWVSEIHAKWFAVGGTGGDFAPSAVDWAVTPEQMNEMKQDLRDRLDG